AAADRGLEKERAEGGAVARRQRGPEEAAAGRIALVDAYGVSVGSGVETEEEAGAVVAKKVAAAERDAAERGQQAEAGVTIVVAAAGGEVEPDQLVCPAASEAEGDFVVGSRSAGGEKNGERESLHRGKTFARLDRSRHRQSRCDDRVDLRARRSQRPLDLLRRLAAGEGEAEVGRAFRQRHQLFAQVSGDDDILDQR